MEKENKKEEYSHFGAAGYLLTIFLFFLFINTIGFYGLKFAASFAISWTTGFLIWFTRILFQSGDDVEGVDKPFCWHLFLLFPLFLPLALPLWIIPFILILCYLISVSAFGGYGKQIFNPVIVAVVFMSYGYSDIGIIEPSRPFASSMEGYKIWTAGVPPRTDIRDIFSSIPSKLVIHSSLKGEIPSIPGSSLGIIILFATFIYSFIFKRKMLWLISSSIFILIFSCLYSHYSVFSIPALNVLILGIIPSLLLCGITDPQTLPESQKGQIINSLAFSSLSVFMLFNSSNILAPAYSFLISQVLTPLIIDITGGEKNDK